MPARVHRAGPKDAKPGAGSTAPSGRLPHAGAALAVVGGATAGAFLLLSAVVYRTMPEPGVERDAALTHALLVLSYLAGGPAITLPLALLTGSVSAAALRDALLPRWLGLLGAAATVASLAAATTFLGPTNNRSAAYAVLLLAALLGFAWLLLASVWLAVRPPRRA